MACDLAGNEDFLQIALIEVPPYGPAALSENLPCSVGRLPDTKEWFVTTPAIALLTDGQVKQAWEKKAPAFDAIINSLVMVGKGKNDSEDFAKLNPLFFEGR